jgi:TolA-binding protein
LRPITAAAAIAAIALVPASALAQRPQPTPEQRLERLERQVQQVQRQVFPRGRPADTAGFSDEPAATQSSVATLDQRLDALERQMAEILRLSEENGHALRSLQSDIATARSAQDQRIGAIEQRLNEAAAAAPVVSEPAPQPAMAKPATAKPPAGKKVEANVPAPAPSSEGAPAVAAATDPGEDAYSEGFHLWEAGQYDQAITSLRAFTSAYPKHRRTSFANNLIGRALLDKGEPRAAAEALLANYRGDPKGERAADSLYYLGQALMKLGQPGQACKAYQELDAVYGDKARADLKKLVQDAESQAQCG